MLSVEGKDLLEADGAIFEAPVSSALLTVAHVVQGSCRNNDIAFTCIYMYGYTSGSTSFQYIFLNERHVHVS